MTNIPSFRPFLLGTLSGLLLATLALALTIRFLPHLLVTANDPTPADAIVILGGDPDGSRLRTGLKLHDDKLAPRLILVAGSNNSWDGVIKRYCPDCAIEGREAVLLEGSRDTRTDAEISLKHCRDHNLRKILVVTSPYHTRRSQFIFNDIADDLRGQAPGGASPLEVTVISSDNYDNLIPPDGRWWADRKTLETVWLELGKILYWELTPFMEFQGEGTRLKEGLLPGTQYRF